MQNKLYLLPGFGEDATAFRNLRPFLRSHDLIDVDYRTSLRKIKVWDTSPISIAKQLIEDYGIRENDKLIGHSMGGYFSYAISSLQHNRTCLINSFTSTSKIVRFTNSQWINHAVTFSGLIKTPLMRLYIEKRNKNAIIRKEMLRVHDNFNSFRNDDMLKMSILSFGEDLPPSIVRPIHLHAMDDRVIRKPDHEFLKVRGGHFSLIFHPDEVYEKIQYWLHD